MRRPPVVLAYHGIAAVDPAHDPVRLFVSPERLRDHIRALRRRRYELLTMTELARRLTGGEDLRGTCALTFDDGVCDALPEVIESTGAAATIYVCPSLMGEPYPWCDRSAGVRLMTAEEVTSLSQQPGIEIGSHTMEHTVLEDASAEQAYAEMRECKQALESMLDRPVSSFAYPRCRYSPACPEAARRAGYTSAVTCGPRGSWDPFELKRESLHTPDGPLTFALKARGAYFGLRDRAPARLARWATRPYRHRAERRRG